MSHVSANKGWTPEASRITLAIGVAEWKWEHVTMDFVTHLPRTSQGHDAMWVIVDQLTKSINFLVV